MPNAAARRRGDVASARLRPDSGNDMRQAHSPQAGDVQCLGGCLWKQGDCDWALQLPNDLPATGKSIASVARMERSTIRVLVRN